ncbi:iron-sulfur cluster-binding domain-containing protein [Thalassotalea ponticola]|uniref:flavin reductase family protein n=1 Tax=Thalassotalea ponticola TaxID=1523392 RepID=UPI0025B3C5AB|nr:iron-sulfur cluster-binding domain-containing protein [Thalassotalea ponticola]MDN3651336.1 iron-sulfur cluster-binding domain-containing protein [Thalassotalea ponticola]
MKKYLNWLSRRFLHHTSFSGYIEPVIQAVKPAWRDGFYRANVVAVNHHVTDTIELYLRVHGNWPVHQSGQHIELTQEINGKLLTRVFTIASAPQLALSKRLIRLVIKQQQQGHFTPALSQLSLGNWVNISSPKGQFTVGKLTDNNLLLVAGSGITPFIAMLNDLKNQPNDGRHVHLLYYAKPQQHLLVDELTALSAAMENFSFQLMTRNVDGDVSNHLEKFAQSTMLVCGPQAFYQSVAKYAQLHDISLYSEHFSLMALTQLDSQTKQLFDVSLNGKQIVVSNESPILSQLLALGEPVSHGCKIGICHQCQCTKTTGVVKNVVTGKLSDRGEELIQLCVSQVMSDVELRV